MRFLSQLSIRIKLILIVLAVSLPVLVLFAIYNILANADSSRERLSNEIESAPESLFKRDKEIETIFRSLSFV